MILMIYLIGCLIGLAFATYYTVTTYNDYDSLSLGQLLTAVLMVVTSYFGVMFVLGCLINDNWNKKIIEKKKK